MKLTTFTPCQVVQLRSYQLAYAAACFQMLPHAPAEFAELMTDRLEVADVILSAAEQSAGRAQVAVTDEGLEALCSVTAALWHLLSDAEAVAELCRVPAAAALVERVDLSELADMLVVLGYIPVQAVSA